MAFSHAGLPVLAVISLSILISISQLLSSSMATLISTHKDYADPMTKPTPSMSPAELDALYQVMEAIAGDTNWRAQHPEPCTRDAWPGVVCEQVKESNDVNNNDSDDTSILVHVTRLDLGYKPNPTCMPNATLPPCIGKLPYLQSLFIFECFTEGNASIPSEIGQLAGSLRELSLRSNPALVGEIPAEVGALTALQVLSLSQNSLYGNIPPSIGKLRSLEHLDLSYNMLSGVIPEEIGALQSLVILDVSMNALIGQIPASIGRLTMIQKMDMSYNALEGGVPEEIGNLRNLQYLSMSDNGLTGPLPSSFANFSRNMQYLIMDDNPINGPIPSFLGQFSNILALSLSNSGYVGGIPESIGGLANLSVLSLDRNNLSGPIPKGLAKLPHIYSLNLSQNFLSGPVPFTPAFVHKLGRNLDLQGNSGLCSHWALPQNSSSGAIMRLCTDLHDSPFPPSTSTSSLFLSTPCTSFISILLLAFNLPPILALIPS